MKMTQRLIPFFYLCLLSIIISSCNPDYTPKPKAYPRIHFPNRVYTIYENPYCPFIFEYPNYAHVNRDTLFFDEHIINPCWLNMEFKNFSGTLHITYEDIHSKEDIAKLLEDAHKLTFKHTKKADAIEPIEIHNKNNVHGLIYDVEGNAASSVQFYVTDMDKHYLRGALYFNVKPNIDSMGPVVDFVKADLRYMIESFKWK